MNGEDNQVYVGLHATMSECDVRMRVFATLLPENGVKLTETALKIMDWFSETLTSKKGSFDELLHLLKQFNTFARESHSEMLKI